MVWRDEVGGELPAKLKSSSKKLSGTRLAGSTTVVVVCTGSVQHSVAQRRQRQCLVVQRFWKNRPVEGFRWGTSHRVLRR
jgi:hypothetical protein